MAKLFENCRAIERQRLADGFEPNPNLTSPETALQFGWLPARIDGYSRFIRAGKAVQS